MDSNNPSSRKPGKVSVLEQPHDSSGKGLALWAVGSGVGQVLESNGEMQMSRLLNISTREDEKQAGPELIYPGLSCPVAALAGGQRC